MLTHSWCYKWHGWHGLTGKPSEMAGILLWLRELGRVRWKKNHRIHRWNRDVSSPCEADPMRYCSAVLMEEEALKFATNDGRLGSCLHPVRGGVYFALLQFFQVLAASPLRWGCLKSQANSDTFIGTHIEDAHMKRLLWLLRWCPRNCCPVWCWNMLKPVLKPSLDMGDKEKHTQCCTQLPYHLYKSCQMRVDQGFVPPRAPIRTHVFPNVLQVPVALFSTKLIKPRCNSLHFPTIMIWLLCSFLLDPTRSKHIESMLVDCTKYSSLVFILYTEALQVVTQTVILRLNSFGEKGTEGMVAI